MAGETHKGLAYIAYILFIFGLAIITITSGTIPITLLIFLILGSISVFSGVPMTADSRSYLGVPFILLFLIVFSTQYPAILGQAFFGQWWPQVENVASTTWEYISPLWDQMTSGMKDAWMLLTNPAQYYNIMMQKQQATASVVKTGGTTKSIELTKFDLMTSLTGTLEPRLDPLIGSIELQNQGEFDANKIILDMWATWKNPSDGSTQTTGTIDRLSCSSPSTQSSTPAQIVTCYWTTDVTYPQEMKLSTFVFQAKSWTLSGVDDPDLGICEDKDSDCKEKSDTCCNQQNATYVHGGQIVNVNANITYNYNVNVSIPIEVISFDLYRKLLEGRQITLQELTSQYTGGPIKATLWSQKQPVRSEELSLFVASIVNEGGGTLNKIYNFSISIPTDIVDANKVEIISKTFTNCNIDTSDVKYTKINCDHDKSIASQEYKRVSFFITPKNVTDRKTSLLVGLARYEYIKTSSQSITVASVPWH